MKYENYDKAKEIVTQINREEVLLNKLEDKDLWLQVMVNSKEVMLITALSTERYSENFTRFIDEIKADLKIRIQKLKDELSDL